MVLAVLVAGAQQMNPGKTISIDEVRQRLEKTPVGAKTIDGVVSSLRAQYGDQVPVVEVVRAMSKIQLPEAASKTTACSEKSADGVKVEQRPDGFLLRASCQSFAGAAVWAIFGGVLLVLPFRVWGDLIRDVWYHGLSLGTGVFFAI
jgi:hypothetical protein